MLALLTALGSLGIEADVKEAGHESSLVIDGIDVVVLVEPRAVMRPSEVPGLRRLSGGAVGVVVSDRVSEAARAALRRQHWGWLDRRGHLRFWWREGRVMIETALPAGAVHRPERPAANPFSPAGIAIAVDLLLEPDRALAVRECAARLGISPGHVSLVVSSLRDQGLVDRARRPLVPELFWALAEHWEPQQVTVRRLPPAGVVDGELAISRWVLGGDLAAARWGAPIVLSERYPPDLYVPSSNVLRLAVHRFGEAAVAEQRVALLRSAPTPRVIDTAVKRRGRWPLAHPVVVALDLAQDPARGRETLNAWTPPDGYRRVW